MGINVDDDLLHNLAALSGCEVGFLQIKHLGLPLGGNPRKVDFWEPVVNKVAKRLASWKKAFLSGSGRLTLIQSVLFSLPIYYLSVFRVLVGVINSIEKMMRDFFWEGHLVGGDHLVS